VRDATATTVATIRFLMVFMVPRVTPLARAQPQLGPVFTGPDRSGLSGWLRRRASRTRQQ
jgi:hypothetical protein